MASNLPFSPLAAISAYDNRRTVPQKVALPLAKMPSGGVFPLMNTTRTETLRQSDRVSFRMPLETAWMDSSGIVHHASTHSLLISRNGGVIRMQEKFSPGQEISLKRILDGDNSKSARARIVAEIDREPEGFLYALHLLEPRGDFWDIEFPSPRNAEEALARLLMECGFCQRREVVHLNEFELK